MSNFKFTDNVDEVITKLKIAGIALQEAGAEALNRGAANIQVRYTKTLQGDLIHNRAGKFTLKACRVYPAKTKKGKQLREAKDINAKVFVPMIGGNREHYLAKREDGGTKRGSKKTENRVAIPLDPARGGQRNAAVTKPNRLGQGATIQGVIDLSQWAGNPRQQYAILLARARGRSWQGKQLKQGAFYMADYGEKAYMFKVMGQDIFILRDMSQEAIDVKKRPLFQDATDSIKQSDLDAYFILAANYKLNDLG